MRVADFLGDGGSGCAWDGAPTVYAPAANPLPRKAAMADDLDDVAGPDELEDLDDDVADVDADDPEDLVDDIEVDDDDVFSGLRQRRPEGRGGRRLTDAAFAGGHDQHFGHLSFLS